MEKAGTTTKSVNASLRGQAKGRLDNGDRDNAKTSAPGSAKTPQKSRGKAAPPPFVVKSTKEVNMTGARVTTVSAGTHHSAGKEPGTVTIKADPSSSIGLSFDNGGLVKQVAPGGQAATQGVQAGWRLTAVGGASYIVAQKSSSKDVLDSLAAARKRGKPYALIFALTVSEESLGVPSTSTGGDGGNAACGTIPYGGHRADGDGNKDVVDDALGVNGGGASGRAGGQSRGEATAGEVVGGTRQAPVPGVKNVDKSTNEDEVEMPRDDGEVTLMYEMYDEKFPFKNGCITAADIDEVYCLSFVMPKCTLHLGPVSPSDRYGQENATGEVVPYLRENPPGMFHGLRDGSTYWVYVSQDEEEEQLDKERMKEVLQGMQEAAAANGGGVETKDDGRNGLESCSCIYGNPCVDEYGCKDWHSRYAVAKANGWKGF